MPKLNTIIDFSNNILQKADIVKCFNKNTHNKFPLKIKEGNLSYNTVSEFEKAIIDGTMTREVITNNGAREYAVNKIKDEGFNGAVKSWQDAVEGGKVDKNKMALGMELYNQCITNKDIKNVMKIAAELAVEATHAGQTLQACRMLKLMTLNGKNIYKSFTAPTKKETEYMAAQYVNFEREIVKADADNFGVVADRTGKRQSYQI